MSSDWKHFICMWIKNNNSVTQILFKFILAILLFHFVLFYINLRTRTTWVANLPSLTKAIQHLMLAISSHIMPISNKNKSNPQKSMSLKSKPTLQIQNITSSKGSKQNSQTSQSRTALSAIRYGSISSRSSRSQPSTKLKSQNSSNPSQNYSISITKVEFRKIVFPFVPELAKKYNGSRI